MKHKYIGKGGFLHGIPRRDLSDQDWARLTAEQKEAVKASPLYRAVKSRKATKKESKR